MVPEKGLRTRLRREAEELDALRCSNGGVGTSDVAEEEELGDRKVEEKGTE